MIVVSIINLKSQDQKKASFTFKIPKDLPEWTLSAERSYTLNDDRIVEPDKVKTIGLYHPKLGEVFFIGEVEVMFNENQVKIVRTKSIVTKTLTSGNYQIIIRWDESFNEGAYSEGTISLLINGELQIKTTLFMSGW